MLALLIQSVPVLNVHVSLQRNADAHYSLVTLRTQLLLEPLSPLYGLLRNFLRSPRGYYLLVEEEHTHFSFIYIKSPVSQM